MASYEAYQYTQSKNGKKSIRFIGFVEDYRKIIRVNVGYGGQRHTLPLTHAWDSIIADGATVTVSSYATAHNLSYTEFSKFITFVLSSVNDELTGNDFTISFEEVTQQ